MKTNRNIWMALYAALLLAIPFVASSQVQIPAAINYQGKLTDQYGNPLASGYYVVEFRIWKDATMTGASELVWGRSFPIHVVTGGLFNILLTDDGAKLSDGGTGGILDAFGGPSRYLGLTVVQNPKGTVQDPSEIRPRQQLVSAPFTIQAQTANAVAQNGVSSDSIAARSVTGAKIAVETVVETNLANSSVSTDKLQDSAVTTAKIEDGAVTTAKIANGAVTLPKIGFKAAVLDADQTFTGQNTFTGSTSFTNSASSPLIYVKNDGVNNQAAKFELNGANLIFRSATTSDGKVAVIENTSSSAFGAVILNPDGAHRVGIGTLTPTNALLEVVGSVTANPNNLGTTGGYGFINSHGTAARDTTTTSASYSIYASGRIAGEEFNAVSDARIKRIHGISDGRQDLKTLLGIQVTDYTMIDQVANGNGPSKKVIAQQIESIYPQAVSSNLVRVIPDIYVQSQAKAGWVALEKTVKPELKAGDMVRLILPTGAKLYEVKEAEAAGFRVSPAVNGQVFVYGRQVHDFRTVDYDAISMLNVSATQELYRRLVASEQAVAKLQEQSQDFQARFTALEKLVHGSWNRGQQASLK